MIKRFQTRLFPFHNHTLSMSRSHLNPAKRYPTKCMESSGALTNPDIRAFSQLGMRVQWTPDMIYKLYDHTFYKTTFDLFPFNFAAMAITCFLERIVVLYPKFTVVQSYTEQ